MTANAMQADKERCLAAGMNGYVSKPINPEDLWRALLAWIKPRDGLGIFANAPEQAASSAQPKLDQMLNELRDIHGLDANRGLSLSNFNAPLYLTMLGKFVKSQARTVDDIGQALANADTDTAERLAHTLKGLSASIGAMPLHESMSDIEQALHEGQTAAVVTRLLAPAGVQLQALVAHLSATPRVMADLAPLAQAAWTPTQEIEIQKVMQTLRKLLEQDDSEVQTLWQTHAPALHSVLPQAQALEQAIQRFDFEEALQLIR
jgi:HPt (histidine-containing phosphotransfer) domain-containing protein